MRPSWNDGRVVALAAYDNGTQFLQVDSAGKIKEIGYVVPPGTEASGTYWVGCDVVYAADCTRGIDIFRLKDPAPECPKGGRGRPGEADTAGTRHQAVTIKRLPKKRFKVKIVATQSSGSKLVSVRTYRGCKKSRPRTRGIHRQR